MGQASTKHVANGLETLELIVHVCNAAEKLAAAKCGKYYKDVFEQTQLLRLSICAQAGSIFASQDLHQQWSSVQDFEQLQGHQVFAVATALQTLSTKLVWCKHKLHQRHLVSLRTLSRKQQATHVLQVLTVAKDAFHNFTTAFKLAVLLSTHAPASLTGTSQQQQHQVDSAAQLVVEQGELDEQHWWQQDEAAEAEASAHSQQQRSNSIAAASRSASHPADSTAHSSHSGDAAAQQEQPQCAPAAPISRSSQHSSDPSTPVADAGTHADHSRQQSVRVTQHSAAEPAAAFGVDAALEGPDDAAVADSAPYHDESLPDITAEWERNQEGWQGLMQRAWRGDVGAVLACAQELIHGGDFCLQDCRLARQLLQTVAQQSSGTACLWLGQLSERGLGLPAPDYVDAGAWFGRGAALGHLECAHALAFYYQHGLGMDHDQQAALEWYEYAADNGLVAAQNNLGHLLLQGLEGVPPDAPAAMQLFQQAADQGSTAAWFNLGVCYELGLDGGKPDTAAAEACFKHAGTPQALLRLGLLYQQQHSTAASREALTAAAEAGSVEALLQLAKLQAGQLQGFTVPPSSNLKQLQQLPACFQTPSWGGCSSSGGSTLLQPAYIAGYWAGTSNSIGGLSGKGSPARPCSSLAACAGADAVLQLYHLAADAGSAEAQHVCGSVCWTRGEVDEAMKAWHAAASQGYGPALLCLAEAAENGLMGVQQDAAAARACYAMAAARGCQQAELQLSMMDREAALESSSWKFLSAAPHQAKVC